MTVREFDLKAAKHISTTRFTGNVDGVFDGELCGWVLDLDDVDSVIKVAVAVDGVQVAQALASDTRADLEESGAGAHAFSVNVQKWLDQGEDGSISEIAVFLDSDPECYIGVISVGEKVISPGDARIPKIRNTIQHDFRFIHSRLLDLEVPDSGDTSGEDSGQIDSRQYKDVFTTIAECDLVGSSLPKPELTKYQVFTAQRFGVSFGESKSGENWDFDRFMVWYVTHYSPLRSGKRIPLTADQVRYLNEKVVLSNAPYHPTRAMLIAAANNTDLVYNRAAANSDEDERYSFEWATGAARDLFLEDVCVTDDQIRALKRIKQEFHNKKFPLSVFMFRYAEQNGLDLYLKLGNDKDRALLYCIIIAAASRRPDYIRFLPSKWIETLFGFGENQGLNHFHETLTTCFPEHLDNAPEITLEHIAQICGHQGMDFHSGLPSAIDAKGNRADFLMYRPKVSKPQSLIRVIGPVGNTSGLGKAARQSIAVLDALGFNYEVTEFSLDDPGSRLHGHASLETASEPASVNLIHMNAEGAPLLYTYGRGIMDGAYNILYPFWELDSLAPWQEYGLKFADEIWTSSEYCTNVFSRFTDAMVSTMGLALEESLEVSRDEGRQFISQRLGIEGNAFVVTSMLDAHSYVRRKNPVGSVKAFQMAFQGDSNVRLILKTQHRNPFLPASEQMAWSELDRLVEADPRISYVDATLTDDEVMKLISGSDCLLSLHRAEGFGLPLAEAMLNEVPVVCTDYSGSTDFADDSTAFPVKWSREYLSDTDYLYVIPGQSWASPDLRAAAEQLACVRRGGQAVQKRVTEAKQRIKGQFSVESIAALYGARLEQLLSDSI